MNKQSIIITISGIDKIGIVAKISKVLADLDVNIEDIKQTIMQENCFVMIMLCEISKSPKTFKEIKEAVSNAANELSMEVWIQRKEIFDKMHNI